MCILSGCHLASSGISHSVTSDPVIHNFVLNWELYFSSCWYCSWNLTHGVSWTMIFLAECQIECDARTRKQLMHLFWCARRLELRLSCCFFIIVLAKSVCLQSLGESLGADNLFSTDIMRTSRQDSHGVNAPQALGSRCILCRGEFEFGSRVAMACHRRHPASIGTPGEDLKSAKPISNTGRANVSSSIVREHATLGTLNLF
jgi:hypothetical protein